MAIKDTNFPPSLYDKLPTTINGIKFTYREIDIITLIFHTRGSSKIAYLLSISTRTVETHTANIMRKMDANSREGIIDFIEKSEHVPWIKMHYRNVLIEIDFKKHLREIYKLIYNQVLVCSLVFERETGNEHFISTLKDYLALCGIEIALHESNGKVPEAYLSQPEKLSPTCHTIYLIPGRLREKFYIDTKGCQLEISHWVRNNVSNPDLATLILHDKNNTNISTDLSDEIPCVPFESQEAYYFSFFEILKRIVPDIKLNKVISEFQDKCQSSHNAPEKKPSTTAATSEDALKYNIFKNKAGFLITTSILIIAALFFWFFIFKGAEFHGKNQMTRSTASIRSDLVIPTGNTFLDRPHLIEKIERSLKDNGGIQTVALVGIGGAGKTTIARKYALQQNANVVWEINAVTRESLKESFERLAYALCKSEEDKTMLIGLQKIENNLEKDQKILLFTKDKLKNISNWFLIYDNVEKFTDIHKYFPCDPTVWGNGKVIVTTNNSNTKNNNFINNFSPIGELSHKEKLTLFLKIMEDEHSQELTSTQKEQASTFLKDVPPYPLDISIAAYYLKSTHTPYGEYLDRLKENQKDFDNIQADVVKEASGYTKTRYGIITLSAKELMRIHKDFQDLLLLISLIDYQNIPKSLLAQYKGNTVTDNFIYHLKKYSLVTNETFSNTIPTISLHKKTQEVILSYLINTLTLSDRSPIVHSIADIIENFILDSVDKEDFSRMKLFAPHGEILLSHDELLSEAMQSSLKGGLGCIYYYLKNYPKIKQFLEENIGNLKRHYGEKNDKIARILIYLGSFYRSLGDHEKAKSLLKQSLIISRENPHYLRSAKALGYLGIVYRDSGKYAKAKDLLEQSLAIYEKHSPGSIGHGWILAYLGNTYRILGDYQKARPLLEQSLKIYKQQSENYIGVAWVFGYLGTVHRLLGDCETAKRFIEKALKITKLYFPKEHIYVATHNAALAKVYIDIGDYQKAKPLLKRSLSVHEASYGKNHIETASVLRMLGEVYSLERDWETSEELLNKSLLIFHQNNNPRAFRPLENLADLFLKKATQAMNEGNAKQAQTFRSQAIQYLKQSLQIIKNSFSENSPRASKIQLKLDDLIKQEG